MGSSNNIQDFDPYHQWLSIPPQHQPANFYRLLGLDLYESDHDVIDVAANRQVAYLRQVGVGSHRPIAARLIDEIRSARKLLLNEKARQRYDRELRATLPAESAGPAKPAKGSRGPAIVIDDGTSQSSTKTARRQDSSVGRTKQVGQRAKKHVDWKIPTAIISIIVLVGMIIFLATRGGSSGKSVNRPVRPKAATPRVASSKAFKSVQSGTRKKRRSVQPTPRRSNPSRTAAYQSSSIADAFERASKAASETLPSNDVTNETQPSKDETSEPEASPSEVYAPAISRDEIDGLEQIKSLPNIEDFEDATSLERFQVAEEEADEEWYELSEGYLRVRITKDFENKGMTLRRDDIQIAAGDSVALEVRIPMRLKAKSQVLIAIGGYQWILQVKNGKSLQIWGAHVDADSGELSILPFPYDNQQPYQLLITRRSDDSALDWWLRTPEFINKVYVGSIVRPTDSDDETSSDGDILELNMVGYGDQVLDGEPKPINFWIDNIRHGQLERQPEVSQPETVTPPTQ